MGLLWFACWASLTIPLAVQAQTPVGRPAKRWVYDQASRPAGAWRMGQRRATIGAEGGPAQFWMIAGVIILEDGSIVVADNGSSEIRVFDGKGTHLRTFGGAGRGPGEFAGLWSIWLAGGFLVGVDASEETQTFSLAGKHLRTGQPLVSPSGQRMTRAGYFADGTALGYHFEPMTNAPSGESVRSMALYRQDRDQLRSLGRFPGRLIHREGSQQPASVVYGPRARVVVVDTIFCVGYPDTYAFACFTPSGEALFEVTRPGVVGRSVTQEDEETFFHGIDVANPGPRGEEYRQRMRQTTKFSRTLPPYGRMVASNNGDIWVGEFVPADETLGVMNPSPTAPTKWSVYSSAGVWLSDVTLPARFRLMDAGQDFVAGVERDENDVERVAVYELRRR
ncbi:MAG TPA: hypothetical protein VLH75_13090 [Longimicrobiales bacterium]|nr:hypothetical protein [Longimicrobiales bacterium]